MCLSLEKTVRGRQPLGKTGIIVPKFYRVPANAYVVPSFYTGLICRELGCCQHLAECITTDCGAGPLIVVGP